jgi:hypothetical protein
MGVKFYFRLIFYQGSKPVSTQRFPEAHDFLQFLPGWCPYFAAFFWIYGA